ncbi:MAG: helix-turn-helix domain-containing protein [Micropepsaceae bacterium]
MEASSANRHERRRTRNRDAILSAAEALFGERGIEAVSIDEIALAADLAKGTVYNHFADKDALAAEIAAQTRADGEARVTEVNAGVADPVRRTIRGMLVFARFAWERPERARAMMRLNASAADPDAPINAGVRADVELGLSNDAFRGDAASATLLVLGTAYTLITYIAGAGLARDGAMALGRDVTARVLSGLGVPETLALSTAAAEAADIFKGETR